MSIMTIDDATYNRMWWEIYEELREKGLGIDEAQDKAHTQMQMAFAKAGDIAQTELQADKDEETNDDWTR